MGRKKTRPQPIELPDGVTLSVRPDRDPDGDRWYWRARLGRPSRKTIWSGWATVAQAVVEAGAAAAEIRARKELELQARQTMGAVIRDWQAWQTSRFPAVITENTHKMYMNRSRPLLDAFDTVPVAVFGFSLMEGYVRDGLREASERTVNLEQRVMGAIWRWGQARGRVPSTPLPMVKIKVQGYRQNHRTPTDEELRLVLAQVDGTDALLMRLLIHTGARVGEVCGAELRLDKRNNRIEVNGKTGPRWIDIGTEIMRDLVKHGGPVQPTRADGGAYARPDCVWGLRLKAACNAANVPVFTSHGIRRAMVRRLRRSGVDVKTAATMMGHSPTVMLRMYDEASTDDLRAAAGRARAAFAEPRKKSKVVNGPWDPSGTQSGSQVPQNGSQE